MEIDKVIVTISGLILATLTYWFFLLKKEQEVRVGGAVGGAGSLELEVDIVVQGGYSPQVVSLKKGKTTKLNFIRKDPNSCLEEVVLGDFKIRKHLPLNEKVTIEITPQKAGEFIYSCGMSMFHGKIVVRG